MRRPNNNNRQRRRTNNSYQSNFGDELKLRGTPSQIAEKYEAFESEALSSKDESKAISYGQHAHHWRSVQLELNTSS